ncbi:hypothetical protein FQN54_006879 [Arachnomyces sp. PD_36]|nr:hypothetical protein FQN54_006879 [Arachnomyces sp. PD_36]
MVYDWDGKREICYQMYIQEKKALEEIMDYMKVTYQFAPSKRAFQTQFKRWGFPSKQNPAHKNLGLVSRVKELWERNTSQRDMLRILNDEGFDIKERELMRVRAKNRWLLRVPNGMKTQTAAVTQVTPPEDEGLLALQREIYKHESDYDLAGQLQAAGGIPRAGSAELSPEVLLKRKERLDKLQAESAERWATRKRRRRTRGWAGLPADPPGPPRFPSETTIDESKRYLNLDNNLYRETRDHFQRICEEEGFIKKTIAGPDKWKIAKQRLINESPHLQSLFLSDPSQSDARALALDVVCTDVTKRMRTLERRMTIAEAKNALGINPEQSRQVRNEFYGILKADHFTSKLEAGDEHWKELKGQWIRGSDLLQCILSPGPADPQHETKVKAVEVLCRDVMKRLRDDQTKRDPSRKQSTPRANTAQPKENRSHGPKARKVERGISNGISTLASQALASAPMAGSEISDMQIDPSLLQAANDPSFAAQHGAEGFGYMDPMLDADMMPTPVYLRVSPQSAAHRDSKTWVDRLSTRSMNELRQLVAARFPDVMVSQVEGTERDEHGHDSSIRIDEDHELDAYLTHVQGKKATFIFHLNAMK